MLEFFANTHTYKLDGVDIPSVSEILRFLYREVYEEPDKFLMDQAADRGTRVHAATEELDTKGCTTADPDISGYVSAYVQFLKDHEVAWHAIEHMVSYEDWYAGTFDRFGRVDGKQMIIDIKTTSSISKKHKVLYGAQLTAYWRAVNCKEADIAVLQLKSDGTYKLIPLEKQDEALDSCLKLHRIFSATKRRKKNG